MLGGFGSAVLEYANSKNQQHHKIECLGLPDSFVEHGHIDDLYALVGLDEKGILKVIERIKNENFH